MWTLEVEVELQGGWSTLRSTRGEDKGVYDHVRKRRRAGFVEDG